MPVVQSLFFNFFIDRSREKLYLKKIESSKKMAESGFGLFGHSGCF